ncbi:Ref family recombination enhancement nuclease [Endozoicomonas montiporae]|uniref:Ref family recombination enhancement nuclease n=1 Tax=Endozoicomonas montiporae TaxID=1027273 RepID=UPI00068BFDF3|nr:Ref family recombination enhancement nuclease [Endozoicomonas montiporae]
MNGRTPNKAERLYIQTTLHHVGCIACVLDGREIENSELWTEFHHNPDFGSVKPDCHFHGFGLCVVHHRGRSMAGVAIPQEIAIRHPDLSGNRPSFREQYGSDSELCLMNWSLLSCAVRSEIGENPVWHLEPLNRA